MIDNKFALFPYEIGLIHFIGIGGIGMSGMASILHSMNQKVQGSDKSDSFMVDQLKKKGIKVFSNHNESNLKNVNLVVKSSSIKDDNIEIVEAKRLKIPIIKRSSMLAAIMRNKHCIAISGTHGKTTTTSLIAKILNSTFDPIVINGGIINEFNSNIYISDSDFLVAEADESDGTFIDIPAFATVITNINPEHLDYYGSFENIQQAYKEFITKTPFFGFSVVCFDDKVAMKIAKEINDKEIISYSINYELADVRAYNIRQSSKKTLFDIILSNNLISNLKLEFDCIEDVSLNINGNHNILNALAACTVAMRLNVSINVIKTFLSDFQGIKRRFSIIDEINKVTVVDDYAHHPNEISATLKSAKNFVTQSKGRVIAIMQPHRYTRLKNLFKEFSTCFNDADIIYITDVYSANEEKIEGIDSRSLIEAMKETNNDVFLIDDCEKITTILKSVVISNDIVIFLGAGDITNYAHRFAQELKYSTKTL